MPMKEVAYVAVATEDTTHLAPKPLKAAPKSETSSSLCVVAAVLLVLNAALLVAVVIAVGVVYYDIETKVQRIELFVNVVKTPAEMPQGMVRGLSTVIGASASTFFFGSTDGTIAQFVDNILSYDFGSLGSSVSTFGTDMSNAFLNRHNAQCYYPVTCPAGGIALACPDGSAQVCDYAGQTINCARASCISPNIRSVSSLVASIGSAVQQWTPVAANETSTDAAFSAGIFRLDLVLEWARRQFDDGAKLEWSAAAAQCQTFATQMKSIQWMGSYISANGNTDNWDVNGDIQAALDYVLQVCNGLAQM